MKCKIGFKINYSINFDLLQNFPREKKKHGRENKEKATKEYTIQKMKYK